MKITGTVRKGSGEANEERIVHDAVVTLTVGTRELANLQTDRLGQFSYEEKSYYGGATLICRVEKPGFLPYEHTRTIDADELHLDIHLTSQTAVSTKTPSTPFEQIMKHPDYSALMNTKPSTVSRSLRLISRVGFGLLWTVVCGGILAIAGKAGEFMILFVAIGIGMVVWAVVQLLLFWFAPIQRVPALVADKRMKVSGGGTQVSSSTTYYATVEFEDRKREEFETKANLYGQLKSDDKGVAFIKRNYLLYYRRL